MRMAAAASRQVDIASLAMFRIIFGFVAAASSVRMLTSGWIEPMYVEPTWFFTYPGFGWVSPWPAWGMYVHYAVLCGLALAIAAGFFYRAAIVLFLVGFTYTQLVDVTNYLNHHYLVILLGGILALLPAHAAWSIDARRRPALARATVPAWMVWLVRFQVGVVYVCAGLAKAKVDWLVHAQPLNLWLTARTETPLVGPLLAQSWAPHVMAWAGFLFDSTIVAWLSWRRTRRVAFAVLVVFHGLTGWLFNIGMFPLIMTSSALIFFDYGWPRRFVWASTPDASGPRAPRSPSRGARIAIALHVILQLALPLRHLAYPGAVLWNEDGMRFAWHVLVREKHGSVTYVAAFTNGKRLEIPPARWLTWRQEREMSGQPDLILQLGQAIAADLEARGFRDFALHAITTVSLNGRAPVPMLDPAVDLRTVRALGSRRWVLPAPTASPPTVRAR